jgi:hypothetical protein
MNNLPYLRILYEFLLSKESCILNNFESAEMQQLGRLTKKRMIFEMFPPKKVKVSL